MDLKEGGARNLHAGATQEKNTSCPGGRKKAEGP